MLHIKDHRTKDQTVQHQWHVGEPLPTIQGRVVTFQADGEELDLILAALDSMGKEKEEHRRIDAFLEGIEFGMEEEEAGK